MQLLLRYSVLLLRGSILPIIANCYQNAIVVSEYNRTLLFPFNDD